MGVWVGVVVGSGDEVGAGVGVSTGVGFGVEVGQAPQSSGHVSQVSSAWQLLFPQFDFACMGLIMIRTKPKKKRVARDKNTTHLGQYFDMLRV